MYGGYSGSFNLSDYAPSDPTAEIPGLGFPPLPVPQQPQPAVQPNVAPPQASSAPSTSARHVNRSQSTNDTRSANVKNRVTTAEYRKDFAQAAPYVPTPINENAAAERAPPPQPTPLPPPPRPPNPAQNAPRATVNVKNEPPGVKTAPAGQSQGPSQAAQQQQARGNLQQGQQPQDERQRRQMEIRSLHEHLTQPGHNQQQGRNPEQVMQQQKDYREQQQIAQRQQQLAIHQQRLHIQNMMQTHGANRNSNDRPDIPVQQPPPPGGVNGNPNNQPLMPVQQQQQQQQRPAPLQPLITPEEAKNPNAVMQMLEFPSAANPMKSNHVRFKGQLFPAEFIIKLFFESNLPILDQLARLLPENHPLHPDNRRRRVELPMNQPPPGYPAPPMSAERLIQMVTNQQVSVGNQPGPSQVGQPVRPPGIIPGMPFNAPPGLMIPPNLNAEQRQQFIQNFMRNQQQFAMHQRMNPNQQSQGQRAPLRVPLQLARLTPVHPNNQLLQQLRGPPPMYNPQEHPSNMATPLQRTDQQPSQPGSSQFPHGMRPLNHAQQMMELAQRNREVQVNPLAAPPVSSFTPAPQSPEPVDVKPTIRTAQVKPNKNQKPAIVTIQDGPSKVQVKREVPDDKVSSSGDAPPTSSSGAQRAVRIKQEPIESDEGSIPRDLNPVESEIIRRQIVAKCEKQKQRELEEMERRHKEEIDRRIDARVEEMLKARLDEELKRRLPMFIDNQNAPEGLPTSSERVESVTSLATVPELGAPEVVQESQVTTSQKDANKKSRSRSDSTDSELAVRPNKKKVIKDSDSEDDEENNLLSRKPARRSATPVRKTRKVIIEDSDDDDMPMVSRKRNRRVDLDEEYRIEKEADDQGDSEMEDFINDGDVTGSEDDEEDSLKDFIADDDEDELPAPKKRSITRESRKRITRSSSRCKQTSKQTKKSSNQRVRHEPKSSEPKSSSRTPKTYEEIEAAKKSKRIKTMNTKEENRRKKHLEQLAAMENVGIERIDGHGIRTIRSSKDSDPPEGFSQLLDCFHTSNDKKNPQRVGERRRTEGSSSTNKRPSTCTKDEDDDFDGVHVPAKRMAHSSSAPKPSSFRKEVPSAAQLGRNRPNQTAMLEKRQNEADDAKIRMEEEYRKLKSKKYPTEQEQLKIRELAKKLSLAKRSVPFPSISAPSSSSVPRKITIKKEIISTPEKLRPPPKILKPHVGSIFTQHRKEAIANIFKHLLEADVADPEGDAQRYELEVAEKAKDAKNYKMSLAHKICYIKRQATSGIVPVNKNAVSHQRILGGGAKENCTVASNRRQHVRPDQLPIEELFPLLVPLKLTHSELQKNAYPLFINGSKTAEIADTAYTVNKKMFLEDYDLARVCSRCNKEFRLNPDGTMIHQKDICRYHNRGIVRDGKKQTFSKRYPCCNEEFNSAPGCKFSDVHVFDQLFKKELKKFVSTPQPSSSGDPRSVKAYALDCEFVYTVDGPALARLTMVDMKNTKVLDVFIKPPSEVLDPNTEFSGLTLEQVQNATDTMQTCHDKLFKLVNSETILIGHSLESDLKAMRIVHMSVIDTAILFSKGDFKTALRTLSSKFLHKHIQGDNEDALGHDSLEDAQACVDLIFYGLKNPESLGVRPSS